MNTIANRILVDQKEVVIDGKSAYKLFLYDPSEGVIYTVISYVQETEIVLNKPNEPLEQEEERKEVEVLRDAL